MNLIWLEAKPDTNKIPFKIDCSAVDSDTFKKVISTNFSQTDLYVNFRNCQNGEALENMACNVCPAGKYNFIAGNQCQDCFLNA